MSIIYSRPKGRNVTYVYESFSVWNKEKQQSRASRKLIGKLDPKTGEIVKTGPRGRKKSRRRKNTEVSAPEKRTNYKKLYEQANSEISSKNTEIAELLTRIGELELELKVQEQAHQLKLAQIRELVKN